MKIQFKLPGMAISSRDIAVMHPRNPWTAMWWSFALPGLGHLCLGSQVKGVLLMTWEILVNVKSHLNQAIVYTFTGQFKKAADVLDTEWALFYGVILFFAAYDSYRTAVEINTLSRLERSQSRHFFRLAKFSTAGLNYTDRGTPWVAAAWSALLTGFGHLYNGRGFKALILLGWAVAIIALSHVNQGIHHTFHGDFDKAKKVLDYEWLLFFPSIYFFAMWDAYNDSVEMNKLFGQAQKNHLRKLYGGGGRKCAER